MSNRALLLVSSNPSSEDRTEQYDDWYATVHIPQILERVPGVTAARRYLVHEASPVQPEQRYLAVYEIEADDPAAVLGALGQAATTGRLDISEALDTSAPLGMVLYREV
jgi:hypothetical protein